MILIGTALAFLSFACSIPILLHAFRRSVGTGVMVLCIPFFIVFYAFTQFEHRFKGAIVAGWLGAFVLAALANASGTAVLIHAINLRAPGM